MNNHPVLPFLEILVIRTCNLSCEGCTTFSDLKYSGYTTWEQGRQWLEPWTQRLTIQATGVMGGEPLINPQIGDWLIGLRKLLPHAQIRFVTNGLLLERHWHIVELLQDLGNTVLKISHHVEDDRIESVVDKIFSAWQWKPVEEFGIKRWSRGNELRFQIAKPAKFLKTFQGSYENMQPHNNDPVAAFDFCVQQRCPLLYNSRIYKCGTVGLTTELLERFNNPNFSLWEPYLDSGLGTECTDIDLNKFINNFGKPHRLCGQCPTALDQSSHVDHRTTVTFKKTTNV
jgi:organic radical activating enzyme